MCRAGNPSHSRGRAMKEMLRPGYKQTEVGVIPEDWEVASLCDVVEFTNGKPHEGNVSPLGPYFLITLDSIGIDGKLKRDHKQTTFFDQSLKKGDIVTVLSDIAHGNLLGLCDVIPEDERYVLNQRMGRLRVKSNADPSYLRLQINCRQSHFKQRGQGTSQRHIYRRDVDALAIPLPTDAEQRAIAAALSDVDALLAKLDQLIAKKRDLKQAAMQQLLTGQTRLPGFSGAWEVKRLGEIGEISGAGVDKKISPNEPPVRLLNYLDVYKKDFLRSGDFSHEVTAKPDQVRRCSVQRGDVFFTPTSEVRDDIGHSAIAVEDIPDVVYSYHVVRLRLYESWDVLYRAYAFKNKDFMNQASTQCEGSGTRYVITLPKFRAITVRFPVNVAEQTAIAAVLSDMDAEITALETRRDKTRALKQGMMQELLTGRIRLV